MRLGIDVDGVAYDFDGALREYLVAFRGFDPKVLPVPTAWHMWPDWNMSKDEWVSYCNEAVDAGYLFHSGPIADDVKPVLEQLREQGHTIHIVTARSFGSKPDTARIATITWLDHHQVPYDSVDFAHDKTSVPCDVFIDDYEGNINALRAAGTTAVVFDQPWNQHVPGPRVKSWIEFGRFIEMLVPA